ncbi:MAG: hypothetical protein JO112_14155 [Planctomycetes bacterium]|nr:hypothetical protein [Planctomycetota bacterium]
MKTLGFFAGILILFLLATRAPAVVVQVDVTPAYLKEHPKTFSIKVEKKDGMLQFTIIRHLSRPQYLVASLTVRQGAALVAESHFPSFAREEAAKYYFSLAPEYLADSAFELAERSFQPADGHGQEVPLPGGIDYEIRLKEFVSEANPPAAPPK